MKNELKSLNLKVDQLLEMQNLILEKLNISPILLKDPFIKIKKLTKKEILKKESEDIMTVFLNRRQLKLKFNLAASPHSGRVLIYMRTKNPKAFDGLKRNKD